MLTKLFYVCGRICLHIVQFFGPVKWGNVGRRYGSYQEESAVLHIPENVMLYFLKKYFLINYGCYKDSHIKSESVFTAVCSMNIGCRE
jgi:hypothetical protein